MPIYRITGPDGRVYRLEGPEGSTPEQALERVRAMAGGGAPPAVQDAAGGPGGGGLGLPQPQGPAGPPAGRSVPLDNNGVPYDIPDVTGTRAPLPPDTSGSADYARDKQAERDRVAKMSMRDRITYGGQAPLHSLMLNIKQLGGDNVTGDVERLRGGTEGSGFAGGVANVASNIAMAAVPASGLQSLAGKGLARVAPKLPKTVQSILAAAGASGAMDAATNPVGEGETRAGNAGLAAATGGAVDAGMRGVAKVGGGLFTPNGDAKKLLSEGITPPLTTSTNSKVGKAVGRATEVFAGALDESKAPSRVRADQQTVAALIRRADPSINLGSKVDARSAAAVPEDVLSAKFDQLLSGKRVQVDNVFATRARRVIDTARGAQQESKDLAHAVLNRHFTPGARWSASSFQKEISKQFSDEVDNLVNANDPIKARAGRILRDVQPVVRQLRDRNLTRAGVNPSELRRLEEGWETAMRLQGASGAKVMSDELTASDLNRAVQKASSTRRFARGEAPNQDLTDTATRLIDKGRTGNPVFNQTIRGVGGLAGYGAAFTAGGPMGPAALFLASRAVQSEPGHKFLLGQYAKQRAMAEAIRRTGGAAVQQTFDTED